MIEKIETAARILLWYLAATFAATQVSLMLLQPHHAHMIPSFFFLIAPIAPWFWIEQIVDGRSGADNIVPLLLTVAISGFGAWFSLRQYRPASA